MKTHTIIMMLTLVVAGLVIGCSSEPAKPAANLTEKEVIELARTSESKEPRETRNYRCWYTEAPRPTYKDETISNFSHTASASFKPSGIWIVMVKSSWNWQRGFTKGDKEYPCTYVVDDATGKVSEN